VGRAQDQAGWRRTLSLSIIRPSFCRQRQEQRRARIPAKEDGLAAAQARPGGLRGEVGRAQEGSEPSFVVVVFISRASSAELWDVHKKRCLRQAEALDDGESSSTGSNDMDTEEEILWKPRAMYAGPGFVVAAPEPSMLPMPTAFLVPVA
jgi:hypothetical protein